MGGETTSNDDKNAFLAKNLVVERRKKSSSRRRKNKEPDNRAVEGYTPRTERRTDDTTTENKAANPLQKTNEKTKNNRSVRFADEPPVFDSIAGLMESVGTLPDQNEPIGPSAVIEADLQFSCLSPEEYEAMRSEAEAEQERVFLGLRPPDENTEQTVGSDELGEGGDVWGLLGDDGDEEADEPLDTNERSFLKLWTALSQWVTPQAVNYVRSIRDAEISPEGPPEAVPKTDIEASRCAGLMNLLKLHISRADVKYVQDGSTKLSYLLRCFNYSQPSPELDTIHVRALTCILLETVSTEPAIHDVPEPCASIGIMPEEYKYLVESAILNLKC